MNYSQRWRQLQPAGSLLPKRHTKDQWAVPSIEEEPEHKWTQEQSWTPAGRTDLGVHLGLVAKKRSVIFVAEELIVCEVSDVGVSIIYTNLRQQKTAEWQHWWPLWSSSRANPVPFSWACWGGTSWSNEKWSTDKLELQRLWELERAYDLRLTATPRRRDIVSLSADLTNEYSHGLIDGNPEVTGEAEGCIGMS